VYAVPVYAVAVWPPATIGCVTSVTPSTVDVTGSGLGSSAAGGGSRTMRHPPPHQILLAEEAGPLFVRAQPVVQPYPGSGFAHLPTG
jgi:hypothetical protein